MNIDRRLVGELVLIIACFTSFALQGCSQTPGEALRIASPSKTVPITLASSADFGCLRSDSESVSRIIEIRNSSNAIIHVSGWATSCECLTVEPSSIDAEPAKSTYIRLVFDPAKEGEGVVGDLRISVDGFGDAGRVCTFDVPASVIAPEDVKHLDGLLE